MENTLKYVFKRKYDFHYLVLDGFLYNEKKIESLFKLAGVNENKDLFIEIIEPFEKFIEGSKLHFKIKNTHDYYDFYNLEFESKNKVKIDAGSQFFFITDDTKKWSIWSASIYDIAILGCDLTTRDSVEELLEPYENNTIKDIYEIIQSRYREKKDGLDYIKELNRIYKFDLQ